VDGQRVHLARCPDCGGMGVRVDEFVVESDCIRCVACGHEFDARLEMMET
jgi:DNA-directed RNA polymerase subunit RPC12/RpoP